MLKWRCDSNLLYQQWLLHGLLVLTKLGSSDILARQLELTLKSSRESCATKVKQLFSFLYRHVHCAITIEKEESTRKMCGSGVCVIATTDYDLDL